VPRKRQIVPYCGFLTVPAQAFANCEHPAISTVAPDAIAESLDKTLNIKVLIDALHVYVVGASRLTAVGSALRTSPSRRSNKPPSTGPTSDRSSGVPGPGFTAAL
jgi:hypothetical protein